jgi:uncharacterized iron-regulated membrane protein
MDDPIHYGTFGGYTTRVLWIFAGLMPGTLFVTSLLMWWNRSLSKKWRRRAMRPPQAVSTGAEAAVLSVQRGGAPCSEVGCRQEEQTPTCLLTPLIEYERSLPER